MLHIQNPVCLTDNYTTPPTSSQEQQQVISRQALLMVKGPHGLGQVGLNVCHFPSRS